MIIQNVSHCQADRITPKSTQKSQIYPNNDMWAWDDSISFPEPAILGKEREALG
jgi:hypothetical protein